MKKAALFIFILLLGSILWAQNRYALVIGNANYPRADDRLPNAINDTNDISAALIKLGYQVELKQNLQRLEMIREISAFITRLRSNRNSEGFFWYAGHAMEIDGENLLLPLDVNVEDDELIRATSFSVTNLTRQLGEARNKVNVVVLDACRVPPAVGGGTRSMGDATRVLRTVPVVPPDLFIIYSTSPGTLALDGTGRRNSPFTEAFLNNINSIEPLTLMVNHVARETMSLTGQRQRPYNSGSIINEPYYSLNPAGGQPVPNPVVTTQTYKIGDRGPAGGIIFYDKGNNSDGWRYLEAAPASTEFRNIQWGNGYVSGLSTMIGSGKKNTQLIVERLRQLGEYGRAAQVCANLNFGGFNDWFLPSIDELDLMYRNLALRGLGGFDMPEPTEEYGYTGGWYSSSSVRSGGETGGSEIWDILFSTGSRGNVCFSDNEINVRAIRSF